MTYLDLGPPVPLGASGDEKLPSLTVIGDPAGSMPANTHLFEVFFEGVRHVFFDLSLFRLPSSGTHYIAVWTVFLSAVWERGQPFSFSLLKQCLRVAPCLLSSSPLHLWHGRAMRCWGLHAGSCDESHLTCERSWPFSSTSHRHKLPWGSQWLRTDVTLYSSWW